jgi:hypothetical protein
MKSNIETGRMSVQEAYSTARKIIAKAREDALSAYNSAFSDFQRKHGFFTHRKECDYEHHGDSWRHLKTYTAPDGACFYECVQYPATEYGLRVEYWSDDARSVIAYL